MIKRPFLWGIGAFIGGILLAWYKIPLSFLAFPTLLGWLLIYFLMHHYKIINSKDSFLWGLPLLMLIGFLAMGDKMKPPDMDMAFEEKTACILTGEITMIVKKPWANTYYLKDNRVTLQNGQNFLVEEVIVNSQDLQELLIGNQIKVSGTIYKFSVNTNPGGFNEHLYYKIQNIDYKVKAKNISLIDNSYSRFHYVLNNIKEEIIKVYEEILPEKEAGTLMAMVLGDKYLLDDEISKLYQENGISHILAISGLHISMVGLAIYYLLKKLRLGLYPSTFISMIFVYSYGVLTNFSVSTNRAVVMYIVLLFANLLGKTFDLLSALSLSAFLILLQNPMQIFHAGFLLSFSAVLGIALLLPCLNNIYKAKSSLLKSVYVSLSAQVFTLPFVLYFFFQLPLYSVFINILVIPFASLLLLTSLLAGIVGIFSTSLGVFLAGGASFILKYYEMVCRLGSNIPGNLITIGRPPTIRIIIYFLLLLIFILGVKKYKKKQLLIIFVIALGVLILPKSKAGLTVTMLDVGQGEAIYMETEWGTNYLIDGGSSDVNNVGRYRLRPFLLSNGISKLDYAIVTHTDMDHVSGLIELVEADDFIIKHIILPDTLLKNETYLRLEYLAKEKGIKVVYILTGDVIIDRKLTITVLHPPKGYYPRSNNDYSTVLSISFGEFDMLLTGDIEDKGERSMINFLNKEESIKSDYDILKVAHHGSRTSTSKDLLSLIKPEIAIISCSKNNNYGHPHGEVLERLDHIGSKVFVTYESGAITIKTDGERMKIEEFLY